MAIVVKSLKKVKFDLGDLDLWPWPTKNYTDRRGARLHILTKFGDDWVNTFFSYRDYNTHTHTHTDRQTNEQTNILGQIFDFCQVIIQPNLWRTVLKKGKKNDLFFGAPLSKTVFRGDSRRGAEPPRNSSKIFEKMGWQWSKFRAPLHIHKSRHMAYKAWESIPMKGL